MNIGNLPSVNFYKTETGCKGGDKWLFPHHKVDEQPNEKPKKGHYSHTRRESDDKNAVATEKLYNNWVASRKTRIRWSQRGKQCKKSWNQLKGYNSPSLRYVKQVFGKRKDHRWEKYKSNILSPYAMKFNDQSHEETARQQRCVRRKAWNLAQNINKLKEKDQVTFYSPAEEWVLPAVSTKEREESEFVADSGASMHMVSKRDLNSAELETMRTSRSPTTVMTTKRRSHGICQRIGLIRDDYAS